MNWKGKNVAITGAAGFIGSHLADVLVESEASVTAIDLPNQFAGGNLSHLRGKIEMLEMDITNAKEFEKINGDIEYVFHLAAIAVPTLCDKNPDIAFRTNVQGAFNTFRFALKKGVKKAVFPSSALLYGKNPKYLPIDEKHPIEISENVYNITKRIGENMCVDFHDKHGLPVVFFRLFNAFGPRQAPDYFIPTVILQAMKTKQIELWSEKPTRDFTYILDMVNAFVKAAEAEYVGGPINIGSGREVRTSDIAKQIAESFGAEIKFLNKEVSGSLRLQCDNSKAKELLGWEPKIPFEDGLDRTISWFKKNGA